MSTPHSRHVSTTTQEVREPRRAKAQDPLATCEAAQDLDVAYRPLRVLRLGKPKPKRLPAGRIPAKRKSGKKREKKRKEKERREKENEKARSFEY